MPENLFHLGLTAGLLYLGPETMMPLVSFLAAILGIILIFWRYIVNFFKKLFKRKDTAVSGEEEITPYVEPEDDDRSGDAG
jgi:undecaprenyl pyrophosphate phosphatase UppP